MRSKGKECAERILYEMADHRRAWNVLASSSINRYSQSSTKSYGSKKQSTLLESKTLGRVLLSF